MKPKPEIIELATQANIQAYVIETDYVLGRLPLDSTLNPSYELVHQVYQRERVDDLVKWRDAVEFPE